MSGARVLEDEMVNVAIVTATANMARVSILPRMGLGSFRAAFTA